MGTRTVFLTGAASGIGRALAEALLARGDRVFACDRDSDALATLSGEALCRETFDVRDPAAWDAALVRCVDRFGPIDVLLNVAGVIRPGFVADISVDDIEFHLDINTRGVILGSRAALPHLRRPGGHLVNVASLAGIAPVPGLALYSASKFAVRGFTLAIASELEELGLKVSCVCPDAVQTPMLDLQLDHAAAAMTFSGSRVLTVEEVCALILGPVLERAPREVTIPRRRGWLAKLASAFPGVDRGLLAGLRARGERRRLALSAAHRGAAKPDAGNG